MEIRNVEDLNHLPMGNRFIGDAPQLINTRININGSGNILVCKKGVKLVNSILTFNGNNSIIYLGENRHTYYMVASVHNNCVLYIGKNNYINNTFNNGLNIVVSEEKQCFIGNNCLFSFDIWFRTADPHLVYNKETNQRINLSKSIFVGDHVWVGQSAMLLKGTKIDSGSIIGAMSLVAGKKIPHNQSWGGNPCRKIAESIFWEGSCVHKWMEADTELSLDFKKFAANRKISHDAFKYKYDSKTCIPYEEIEKKLSSKNTDEILEYLDYIYSNNDKNRFVHKIEQKKKVSFVNRIKNIIRK